MSADPEWFKIALLMQDMGRTLPDYWDHTSDFWLGGVQCLAETIVALRGVVPVEQLGSLLGAGGMMVAHAVRQAEAAGLTTALFSRIRGGAGD